MIYLQSKTTIFLIFILGLFAMGPTANAQAFLYMKGALGSSSQGQNSFAGGDIDYQSSGVTSFSLGLNMSPQVSTEMELSYRSSDIDTIDGANYFGQLSSSALMFNGYFKVPMRYGYSFFVGAGVGFLAAELEDLETGNYANGSSLASQFMFGFNAEISNNVDFSIEYKSIAALDLELSGTSGAFNENFGFNNGSLLIGLTYNF